MNHSFTMLTSLFPLIDKDFPQNIKNQKEIKNSVEQLLMTNLNLCQNMFGLLRSEMLQAEPEKTGQEARIYVS